MNRIEKKFLDLKNTNHTPLIAYVVGGYPDMDTSEKIIISLVESGVDIIEIGIPFSDPIADGPTIQEAIYQSLSNNTSADMCLKLAYRIRIRYPSLPLIIMTYSNIIYHDGFQKFMKKASKNGIDGFIIPDVPIEESQEYLQNANKFNLSTIFLVSPNTTVNRLNRIVKKASGFLYVVSVYGTTGERKIFDSYTMKNIKNVKDYTKNQIPIAVGFGISKPEHVETMIKAGADSVIIGSAIVKIIQKYYNTNNMLKEIKNYIKKMKQKCKLQSHD